jgi:replicative DNA helicase
VKHHDVNAEHAILAALMTWPETADRIGSKLRAEDFAVRSHQAMYAAIMALHVAGHPVDVLTVHNATRATAPALDISSINEIAQSLTSRGSVKRYVDIVREFADSRAILEAIDSAVEIANESVPSSERAERITALFSGLARSSAKAPRLIGELMAGRIDHYNALADGTVAAGWPTRIGGLDRHLSGGLRAGKVYVIAARPKVGKSSLAQQIGTTMAKAELPTLMLSQEMGVEELADRAVANLGRVSLSSLMTGKHDDDDGWNRIADGIEATNRLPLWVDDQGSLTIADIRAKARGVKGLKVLLIDYVQLCDSDSKREQNRNGVIEEISRGIKGLSKELDIAVIVLSQLNRKVEERAGKRPNLGDLRDSGAIEQDADAVIFLWPAREHNNGETRLIGCEVAANRSGPCGEFALDFDGRYQRWGDSMESIHSSKPIAFSGRSKAFQEAA